MGLGGRIADNIYGAFFCSPSLSAAVRYPLSAFNRNIRLSKE
jgi:hypothetical protein